MKIRFSFVSNSSSSSFIVSVKKNESKAEVTIKLKVDLSKYGKIIETEEDLNDYYKNFYGYCNIEEMHEECLLSAYKKSLKAIKSGRIIIMGDFSDETNDPIERFLCMNGISQEIDGVEVIESEGGY